MHFFWLREHSWAASISHFPDPNSMSIYEQQGEGDSHQPVFVSSRFSGPPKLYQPKLGSKKYHVPRWIFHPWAVMKKGSLIICVIYWAPACTVFEPDISFSVNLFIRENEKPTYTPTIKGVILGLYWCFFFHFLDTFTPKTWVEMIQFDNSSNGWWENPATE